MFEKVRRLLIAAMLAPIMFATMTTIETSASDMDNGTLYFRYRTSSEMVQKVDPIESKDIVAFFMGGVGVPFEEKLPVKAKWIGLKWKVVGSNAFPKGITFDNSTRLFSGTPEEVSRKRIVEMAGFNSDGMQEATAQITFDIFKVIGEPFKVTLYAHTGKYKYDVLPSPKLGVVDKWNYDADFVPPPGISVNGPYYEGTPSEEGQHNIHLEGVDYKNDVIATYFVKYIVEDGPTFDEIPDDIRVLAPEGRPGWTYSGYFNFGAPSTYSVNNQIDPAKPVKYFLRIDSAGKALPGSVTSNNDPLKLKLSGFVTEPYDTVTAHFFAIDSDGTTGRSNSFTFGTSDPTPLCRSPGNYSPVKIVFTTGKAANVQLSVPFGAQGTGRFSLASDPLPEGLTLTDGGRLVGIPMKAQPATKVLLNYELTSGSNTITPESQCQYILEVVNQKLKLFDATSAQAQHGRIDAAYAGAMAVTGGIPDYSVNWVPGSDHETLSAPVPAENSSSIPVTGKFKFAALPHAYGFNLVNGDGNLATGTLNLFGYGPLSFGSDRTAVPDFVVQRLGSGVWGKIPYDDKTVVPDTSGAIAMPVLTLDKPTDLPDGISFDGRSFVGVTQQPEGRYGPFRATMSDYTGESIVSDDFYVTVKPRAPVSIAQFVPPVFTVEQLSTQRAEKPVAAFPPGADKFVRTWKLEGPALPTWARFDPTTGVISADPEIPYGELKQPENKTLYGPYTLTVSDDDPLSPSTSVPTTPFHVTLIDMPAPTGTAITGVEGTVSGDADQGISTFAKSLMGIQSARTKTVTNVSVRDIRAHISPGSIVGDVDDVLFLGSDPVAPAGLLLQVSQDGHDAWFDGSPTKPFKGEVKVKFKDIRGRVGSISVFMEIRPYPSVHMRADSFDLPRLAPAGDYDITAVSKPSAQYPKCPDCWTRPAWSLETTGGPLPLGLGVHRDTGVVEGRTDEIDDTTPDTRSPFEGIVLKAVSKDPSGREVVSWTQPFSINVKPRVPMKLEYPNGTDTWYLINKTPTTPYSFGARSISEPHVAGSSKPALKFSANPAELGRGQTLHGDQGTVAWDLTTLGLGEWNPLVTVTDSDGQQAAENLKVKATLTGNPIAIQGGAALKLRASEPFVTDDMPGRAHVPSIVVDNAVGDMTYALDGKKMPPTMSFLATSGAFLDTSRIDEPGIYSFARSGTDADGRKLEKNVILDVEVIAPLAFSSPAPTPVKGRQYDANAPIVLQLPKIDFALGNLSYKVVADSPDGIPGQIVYKVYDSVGETFLHWQWTDKEGREHLLSPSDSYGRPNDDKLPDDALVFDAANMTLKGIASRSGSFPIAVVVTDDHMEGYLHIDDLHPLERRVENNTAKVTATIVVEPALPLEISMKISDGEAVSETFREFTQTPALRGDVTNAAYGKPLVWTLKAGALPSGITPYASGTDLRFGSYATGQGTFSGIVVEGVDRAGRKILTSDSKQSSALTFTVIERERFSLAVAENPRRMAVNLTDANLTVTSLNAAYGILPDKKSWVISGQSSLPPGVTITVGNGSVNFSGVATKIGDYGPVTVSTKDAAGASASVAIRFTVRIPDGPIVLEVSDARTKPGYPYSMVATSDNTYGVVTYNSYAINSTYKSDLKIDNQTGRVEGSFKEPQKVQYDVWVTDTTNRVTSAPVSVEVIPFVRVVVPEVVKATETKAMKQEIATDYVLGTVRYKKGQGTWPDNIDVDPITGTISGTSKSLPGDYVGLTITATDTFVDSDGNMQTDVKDSNAFKIALDGIPDIEDVNSTSANRKMLFTRGVPITPFVPKVIDAVTKQPFALPGTEYTVNKDFEHETGLSLDPLTGTISGTPSSLVVYTDFTMTVTSPNGNSDTTKPFYFAIQPQGSITAQPGQRTSYSQRMGELFATNAVGFDNTVGVVAYTQTTSKVTFNPATGAIATRTNSSLPSGLDFNTRDGSVSGTASSSGDYEIVVKAIDGAGRQATFSYVLMIRGPLSMTVTKPISGLNIGQSYNAINTPTATNVGGKATFVVEGLPKGITFSAADGSLTGSPSAEYANGTVFTIKVKITDSFDGQYREASYPITVALPILAEAGQKATYTGRINSPFTTDLPIFTNSVGSVTFSGDAVTEGVSGLSLNPATGVISGTPAFVGYGATLPESFNIKAWSANLKITDETGRTGELPFTITIRRPLTLALSKPTVAIDFDQSYAGLNVPVAGQVGGTLTYTSTGLPIGLSVNPQNGGVEGIVAKGAHQVGDTFAVTVTATDSFDGSAKSVSYTLTVADAIVVTAGQIENYVGRVGDVIKTTAPKFENAFGAVTLTQVGKPSWMTFNTADGTASGTVTTATTGTTTITLTDSIGRSKSFAYGYTTKAALGMSLTPVVNGIDIGTSYAAFHTPTVTGIGGTAAFEDVDGQIAATGLSLNPTTGGVSGSPSGTIAPGTSFQALVKLTDSFDMLRKQLADTGNVVTPASDLTPYSRSVTYPLTVANKIAAVAGTPPSYATRVGDTVKTTAAFTNTVGSVTFTQTGKAGYLAFDATTGVISGVTSSATGGTVTLTVKDAIGRSASQTFTILTRGVLGISVPNALNGLDIGKTYAATNIPSASNVSGTVSYEDVGGVIASTGMTFDSTKGGFSGTLKAGVAAGDTFSAKVRIRDSFDVDRQTQVQAGIVTPPQGDLTPFYREVDYVLTAGNPIIVPAGQKTDYIGRVGDQIATDAPLFSNTIGTVTYTATGLPSGLSVNPATGVVSGTISVASTNTITITAKDSTGRTALISYKMTTKGVLTVTVPTLTTEIRQSVGQPYSAINRPTTTNVGGTITYTQKGLPAEFTLDPVTGSITGTVGRSTYANGTRFEVALTATDSFDGHSKDLTYALNVVDAPAPRISVAFTATGYSAVGGATVTPTYSDAKVGDVVTLAPGSAPLPPGFNIAKVGNAWVLQKTASTEADIGVYRGVNLRVTDVDGLYGDTGPQDILLRSASFLAYPTVPIGSRTLVPVDVPAPTISAGRPIADVTFAFSKDVTGGSLKIDAKTGAISGSFTANGTNIVTVTESYDGKTIRTFTYNVPLTILPLSISMDEVVAMVGQPLDAGYVPETVNTLSSGTYSLSGAVPSWLTVDPSTGALSGMPDKTSLGTVTLTYSDAYASAATSFRLGVTGGSKGFKYLKFEKATTWRTLLSDIRFYDEYGIDAMKYAKLHDKMPTSADFSAFYDDAQAATGVDHTGDATVTFVFPSRINFSKATYVSNLWENYCIMYTASCPVRWWDYKTAPARIYGSNDGVNFVQIGSAAQITQARNNQYTPIAIPLTQQ